MKNSFVKCGLSALLALILLAGCGGGGGGGGGGGDTNSGGNAAVEQTYVGPSAPQEGTTPAITNVELATTHSTSHANESIKLYVVGDNVMKLPDANKYIVNNTIEFADTVVKITSVIADGVYGYTEAQLADVFKTFEIKGSVEMTANAESSPTVQSTKASTSTLSNTIKMFGGYYNDIKNLNDKGCIPDAYPGSPSVTGDASNHKNNVGVYSGKRISLKNCEIFKDATGSIKINQDINVGMMVSNAEINLAKGIYKLNVDGAYFLDGKIEVASASGKQIAPYKTRLYEAIPDYASVLPKDVAKTVSKVLQIKLYVDLKTVLDADIIATAAYQVPGDFAFGFNVQHKASDNTWSRNLYTLKDGSNVKLVQNLLMPVLK